MTEYPARIILSNEVYKQINWFTRNINHEIGGLGTVSIKSRNNEKYFYVEKLFYPKQYTTVGSVHFGSAELKDIIKNCTIKEFGKLNFYWHKHPSSAAHSHTDEIDTYDTYTAPESNVKYFLFLQTALKGEKIDREARIDLKSPIRTTILNSKIKLNYELSADEKEQKKTSLKREGVLEKYCKSVLENIKPDPITVPVTAQPKQSYKPQAEQPTSIDNDMIRDCPTSLEEKVAIDILPGGIRLVAGSLFQELVDKSLTDGNLKATTSWFKSIKNGVTKIYTLQPLKGCLTTLQNEVMRMFQKFNMEIYNKQEKVKTEPEEQIIVSNADYLIYKIVAVLLNEKNVETSWYSERGAVFNDIKTNECLGYIVFDCEFSNATVSGKKISPMFVDIKTKILNSGGKK